MTQNGPKPPLVCHGHTRPIPELNFSPLTPDGHFLVTACKDGKAMLRRGETGDWIGTFDGHGSACVWSCAVDRSALLAATASADFTCKLWDAVSGVEQFTWTHPHIVRSAHFAAAAPRLVTGCRDKTLRVFDVTSPAEEPVVAIGGLKDAVRTVKFLADDNLVLTSFLDKGGAVVYDLRSSQVAHTLDVEDTIKSVDVAHDGSTFTTAGGSAVGVYDASTLQQKEVVHTPVAVESASVCLAQRRLVTGGQDMWAHLLEYPSGAPITVFKGHHGPVWSIQFAHDGNSFASASEDGTVRIWFPTPSES